VIDIFVCTAVLTRKNLSCLSITTSEFSADLHYIRVSTWSRNRKVYLLSGMWWLAIPVCIFLGHYYDNYSELHILVTLSYTRRRIIYLAVTYLNTEENTCEITLNTLMFATTFTMTSFLLLTQGKRHRLCFWNWLLLPNCESSIFRHDFKFIITSSKFQIYLSKLQGGKLVTSNNCLCTV